MGKGYKTSCPACGGHNLYVTPHNGIGYCFNCGYTRRQREHKPHYARRSSFRDGIRAVYTAYAQWCAEHMRDEHYAYLEQRGITRATAQQYCIGYCPPKLFTLLLTREAYEAGLITTDRKPFLAGRILIPYLDTQGTVIDLRGRVYDPAVAHLPDVKYLSPYRSAYYRWADIPYNAAALQSPQVVITEGELKALASVQAGIPSVALPGIRSFRDGLTDGLRMSLIVNAGADVVICFDHQRQHMNDVYRAVIDLVKRLRVYTTHLRVATLPLVDDDEKMDIDTYILRYGVEAYRSVIASAPLFDTWYRLIMQ